MDVYIIVPYVLGGPDPSVEILGGPVASLAPPVPTPLPRNSGSQFMII